jgi:hypothetical protein
MMRAAAWGVARKHCVGRTEKALVACGASHFPSLFLTCQAKVTDLFRLLFLDQS